MWTPARKRSENVKGIGIFQESRINADNRLDPNITASHRLHVRLRLGKPDNSHINFFRIEPR